MKNEPLFVAGYVRLSRDDNKKNYASIENQKLLIMKFADAHGWNVNAWYEDDGVSGYSFQRPDFCRMIQDLETKIDIIIAKDLSRIGRHNAKVLLFLEELAESGKRLLLIDDHYDTKREEDDVIGIKTWYNERYIKDTSKKIRSILSLKQKEGVLALNVPFGYQRTGQNKEKIEIEEASASIIRMIFDLYLEGNGFRAISCQLNKEKIPTPSMMEKQRQKNEYRKKIAVQWNPSMVGSIIKNDFYIGTLRYHKRERIAINGKERRTAKEEQIVFQNNHKAIIESEKFIEAQKQLQQRKAYKFRGEKKKQNRFSGLLYCYDCGKKMVAVNRKGKEKYYICSTYNKKGKDFCSSSHMVYETVLEGAIQHYLEKWMQNMKLYLVKMDYRELLEENKKKEQVIAEEEKKLFILKEEFKKLLLQKLQDCTENDCYMQEKKLAYQELEEERLKQIRKKEEEIKKLQYIQKKNQNLQKQNGLELYQKLVLNEELSRAELKQLIQKILVKKKGNFEVFLQYKMKEDISM